MAGSYAQTLNFVSSSVRCVLVKVNLHPSRAQGRRVPIRLVVAHEVLQPNRLHSHEYGYVLSFCACIHTVTSTV